MSPLLWNEDEILCEILALRRVRDQLPVPIMTLPSELLPLIPSIKRWVSGLATPALLIPGISPSSPQPQFVSVAGSCVTGAGAGIGAGTGTWGSGHTCVAGGGEGVCPVLFCACSHRWQFRM